MRKEYMPGEPHVRVESISTVIVRRDKNYTHSYKNGRTYKNGRIRKGGGTY